MTNDGSPPPRPDDAGQGGTGEPGNGSVGAGWSDDAGSVNPLGANDPTGRHHFDDVFDEGGPQVVSGPAIDEPPATEPDTEMLPVVAAGVDPEDPPTTQTPARGMTRAQRRRATEAAARPPRDLVRTLARGIGQTLISAGLVVLLFVVYELWITDIFTDHKQSVATSQMDQSWADATTVTAPIGTSPAGTAATGAAAAKAPSSVKTSGTAIVTVNNPSTLVADPAQRKRTYQTFDGKGFAKIYIPELGPDYVFTIIEGTSTDDLAIGPGHYADTQYPGDQGNFAVAGHRVSHASPFNELGTLSSCNAIVIETQDSWYVYRVLPMQNEVANWSTTTHTDCAGVAPQTGQYAGLFGREITVPTDYSQVLPVPHVDSTTIPTTAERLITLTTCHPQFSDAQRMIIHGTLVKTYSKTAGFTPPELNEG